MSALGTSNGKDGGSKPLWAKILLIISILANAVMILTLIKSFISNEQSDCKFRSWPSWQRIDNTTKQQPIPKLDSNILDGSVRFRGKLTHVLYSVNNNQKQVDYLIETFDYWRRFPPCLMDSFPIRHGEGKCVLVIYFDSAPESIYVNILTEAFTAASKDAPCFASIEFRHAGMPSVDYTKITLLDDRLRWREYFKTLVSNTAGLTKPEYVLILDGKCRPVQSDWLNQVDMQTRPPNEHAWLRGSIFQGYIGAPPQDVGQLIRLSPSGLYYLGDATLEQFYTERVLPWTTSHEQSPIIEEFGDKWTVDVFQYLADNNTSMDFLNIGHQFRHAHFISDYNDRNVSLKFIQREQTDTVLVCGNLID